MNTTVLKNSCFLAFLLLLQLGAKAQVANNNILSIHYLPMDQKDQGQSLHLKAEKGKESLLIFNEHLSKMYNLAIEFDVVPKNSLSKFGVIGRYVDKGEWTYVGCDLTSDILTNSHWYVGTPKEKKEIAVEISKFYKNYKRHVRIEYIDKSVAVYIDGEKISAQHSFHNGKSAWVCRL